MERKLSQFTWRQWLLPRSIDGIGLLIYLVVLGVYSSLVLTDATYLWLRLGVIVVTILFLLFLDRLEYLYYDDQPSWRQAGALTVTRVVVVSLILLVDGQGELERDFFFGAVVFGFLFFIGSSYNLTGLVWLVGLLDRFEAMDTSRRFAENEAVLHSLLILGVILIFYVAHLIRQERLNRRRAERLVRELEESHHQLRTYAAQVAELATTEERNRLARDIHDSLGHYLSVINVQLEKAITFRNRNPDEADQAVRDSKRLAGEALQEVRRSVSALRSVPEPFSLVESLRRLVDDAQTGQFSIDLAVSGDECGYSRQSLLTLYRAAQEGLTNVQKHAQASRVTMQLQLDSHQASLSIADDGRGFEPASLTDSGGRYGLRGAQERLEILHGSLKLESVPGRGTTLFITVPKDWLALGNGEAKR